ncbi:MAG: biotin--[acetyl-CoA-carboxylase] ligase [Pseudomonadota bacterium]
MNTNNPHIFQDLIQILADGHAHTTQDLAKKTGLAPTDISAAFTRLTQQYSLTVRHTASGYCLQHPLNLLEKDRILATIPATQRDRINTCTLLPYTDSTNRQARQHPPPPDRAAVWLTEYQTAGRGRRGRRWIGSFARQLLLSVAYTYKLTLHQISGLSIATGAVLADSLTRQGATGLSLKWPNDLHWHGQKVAGILLEAQSNTATETCVVLGIGINVYTDTAQQNQTDQPSTSLEALGITPDRNQLAGELIRALLNLCTTYPDSGLAPYLDTWQRYDPWRGREVIFSGPQNTLQGRYIGLDDAGHLLLDQNGTQHICHTGTLRLLQHSNQETTLP